MTTEEKQRLEDLEEVVADLLKNSQRKTPGAHFYWPERGPARRLLLRMKAREAAERARGR